MPWCTTRFSACASCSLDCPCTRGRPCMSLSTFPNANKANPCPSWCAYRKDDVARQTLVPTRCMPEAGDSLPWIFSALAAGRSVAKGTQQRTIQKVKMILSQAVRLPKSAECSCVDNSLCQYSKISGCAGAWMDVWASNRPWPLGVWSGKLPVSTSMDLS